MMLPPKLLLAALAAFVFLFLAGAAFYDMVFPGGAPGQFGYPREEPLVAPHLFALLVTSFLLAYIFPKGYGGRKPWAEGMRFGMLVGALGSIPTNLHVYAAADTPAPGLVTVVLWTVITWGVSGGLIGAVYGKTLREKQRI
ncbi:MAG: hypothetical protein KAT30_08670 [Candidatus Krumholzibacteria bacterium]|nr:hypothetical protein [Candidatus Krumholzibacteria bacterium]